MKKGLKLLSLVSLLVLVGCATPTNPSEQGSNTSQVEGGLVDYASQLKLDTTSNRARTTATLKSGIDGDTSHFYVDEASTGIPDGILKARYLGIDTPESTGKVEPWGKTASKFTTGKLTTEGVQIILESEDSKWNADSTGSRYLVYVWYKTPDMADYKLLNLEIMQEGLAYAKNMTSLCYGTYFSQAYNQALTNKLKVFGKDVDPNYYYGAYIECTIKGLRENPSDYEGKLVRFEGLITKLNNNTAYAIDVDEDTGLTYGMQVYYGYGFSGEQLMVVGSKLSFCGTYAMFQSSGTYQVSGLTYFAYKDKETNLRVVEENVEFSPLEVDGTIMNDNEKKELYGGLSRVESLCSVYVSAKNLTVESVYTTTEGDSKNAMTLTCKDSSGKTVTVRTEPLKKADGTYLAEADVKGKTIDVTGVVDQYTTTRGTTYQIRVFGMSDLAIK